MSQVAYCAKCGNVIDMSDSFCKSCGEKIKNNVAPLHGPKAVNENKMDQEQWNKLTKEHRILMGSTTTSAFYDSTKTLVGQS